MVLFKVDMTATRPLRIPSDSQLAETLRSYFKSLPSTGRETSSYGKTIVDIIVRHFPNLERTQILEALKLASGADAFFISINLLN